jgi:HEPN domain-containing protein
MLNLNASKFVTALVHVSNLEHYIRATKMSGRSVAQIHIAEESFAYLGTNLELLLSDLNSMEMPVSALKVSEIALSVQSALSDLDAGEVKLNGDLLLSQMQDVGSRIRDELNSRSFLALNGKEMGLFAPPNPLFGEDVSSVFSTAAEDIEEAGKCLALGRYTAAVFHLMRAMEAAVKRLASKLNVVKIDIEWGKLLGAINDQVKLLPKGDEKDMWSENVSLLYHVKQAWRNDTMHPKNTYTEEQANEIFAAVRSFMKNLAPLVV